MTSSLGNNTIGEGDIPSVVLSKKNSIHISPLKLFISEEKLKSTPKRRTKFLKKWLKLPVFQDWLVEGLLSHQGFCRLCRVSISATKKELLMHTKSQKHVRNLHTSKNFSSSITEGTNIKGNSNVAAFIDDVGSSHILRVIDLRSDSISEPSNLMKKAMVETQHGDTSFGSDVCVKELEDSVALMLGKESGLFFPTHVMANLVAVLTHCQARGSAVIAGEDSDISLCNKESLIKFGGLHFCSMKNEDDGSFPLEDLEKLSKTLDFNYPLSCVVCFECPHARKGGRIPNLDWIDTLGDFCLCERLMVHCDGTRLANATLALNVPAAEIVRRCDSVTFGLDKGLGAPLGAVLVGSDIFIKRAAFIRNFLGGNIHQAGIFASAGSYAIKHKMSDVDYDNQKAKSIAEGLSIPKKKATFSVNADNTDTNIVHFHCSTDAMNAFQLKARLCSVSAEESAQFHEENVIILGEVIDEKTLALMVHNKITAEDIKALKHKLNFVLQEFSEHETKRVLYESTL